MKVNRLPLTCKRLLSVIPLLLCLGFCLGPAACTTMPRLSPFDHEHTFAILERCHRLFPTGPRQFVHRIDVDLPTGRLTVLLGVIRINPIERTLHAILLTPEQLVVFEAVKTEAIQIRRSLPPFDAPGWAEGLFADIELFLLPPDTARAAAGAGPQGQTHCRYHQPTGHVVDIMLDQHRPHTILEYDGQGHRLRTITLAGPLWDDFQTDWWYPSQLKLTKIGHPSYTLRLTLLQTETHAEDTMSKETRPEANTQ